MVRTRKYQLDENQDKEKPYFHPWMKANFISRLFFWWINPMISLGNKRILKINDMHKVIPEDESQGLGMDLEKKWLKQVEKSSEKNKPSFIITLLKMFGSNYIFPGLLVFLDDCVVKMAQPFCLSQLINYFNSDNKMSIKHAYLYATGVVLGAAFSAFSNHLACFHSQRLGMRVRVATSSLIFRKSLRLSQKSLNETPIGQMINIISNDVNRFDQVFLCLHYIWSGPLATILATIFLYNFIGMASLSGIIFLIILVPLQLRIRQLYSALRKEATLKTDDRIGVISEIIPAMRIIKMYTWEEPFIKLAQLYRKLEMQLIRKISYFRAFNVTLNYISAKLMIFPALIVVVLTGNELTATKVFLVVAIFNNIRVVVTNFTFMIQAVADTIVAVKRIEKCLLLEEIQISKHYLPIRIKNTDLRPQMASRMAKIEFNKVSVKWPVASCESEENSLSDVSFKANSGQLLTVFGKIGAGKSTLLNVILGELPILSGTSIVEGKVAYCSQEPWIIKGTIRQNIACGKEIDFDIERYDRVIRAAALGKDFEQLPRGDLSIIGEGGVSLSGGQKSRVNLARCLYVDADIYLLDDPLSAVDTQVGCHIFKKAIKEFLKGKICVLVTHHLEHLADSDTILLLNLGKVEFTGTYQEFKEINLQCPTELVSATGSQDSEDSDDDSSIEKLELIYKKDFPSIKLNKQMEPRENIEATSFRRKSILKYARRQSRRHASKSVSNRNKSMNESRKIKDRRTLLIHANESISSETVREDTEKIPGVSPIIYWKYFRSGAGLFPFMLFTLNCIFTESLFCASDYWLNLWSRAEQRRWPIINLNDTKNHMESIGNVNQTEPILLGELSINIFNTIFVLDTNVGIYIYSILIGGVFFFGFLRALQFHGICTGASEKLHDTMFQAVLRAPIAFFDKNPVGNIVNRFTKDTGSMDDLLPTVLFDPIWIGLNTVGAIVTVSVVKYWLLFPALILGIAFYLTRKYYLKAAIPVKQIEANTKNPVFTQLFSSMIGLTTLRAHNCQAFFQKDFDRYQDIHSSAKFICIALSRWLGVWMDMLLLVYVAIVTYACVLIGQNLTSGEAGLIISAAMGLGLFQVGMRQSAEMVNLMTSVDRIIEYGNISPEASLKSSFTPPLNWPSEGLIKFEDVNLRYSSSEPPVLKNIQCTIKPCEKIGIVGRSGAGKSTIIAALFRLTEPDGEILIDGIDSKTIGLRDLRSKISIIPQEPTLFTGTLRSNLDPFGKLADDILWAAIDDVHLDVIMAAECGSTAQGLLDFMVSEGGANLSVGQRQLICLVRAILLNNRIIILDEATASVDKETDTFIQLIIKEKFQKCTVLTIAHRLDTIMDSDKIMVLDFGQLVEFDEPDRLLSNRFGTFRSLVDQTGPEATAILAKLVKVRNDDINSYFEPYEIVHENDRENPYSSHLANSEESAENEEKTAAKL